MGHLVMGVVVDAVGCSLGGVGTVTFSMSKILDTSVVPLRPSNRPVHAIGVGSNCTVRLTMGGKLHVTVVANKHARTIHVHFSTLKIASLCVNSTIGVRSCHRFHSGCNFASRRVVCVKSSIPSVRIVRRYNLPYYPGSTTPRMGGITGCVSRTTNNCNYNHSIVRRMLGMRKG